MALVRPDCQNPECAGVIDDFGHRTAPNGEMIRLGRCVPNRASAQSCGWRYLDRGAGWVHEPHH